MYHHKRAQVTYFIVIAAVLLFLAVYLFTLREEKVFLPPEAPVVQEAPFDVAPIHSFVTSCIEQTSKTALVELGRHSGYIDPGSAEYGTRAFRLDHTARQPTEAEALPFSSSWHLPYWHHLASPNAADRPSFKQQAPSDADVEKQVSAFVEKNLPSCLNFGGFAAQGFTITPAGSLKVTTTLAPNQVVVTVTYPLKITKQASVYELKDFIVRHDVALKPLLDFSRQLTNTIVQGQSFEKVMLLMLSGFSGLNNELPPLSESQYGGQRRTWRESEVKPKVEAIMHYAIDKIPVRGTANYVPFEQRDLTLAADPVRLGTYRYLDSLEIPAEARVDPQLYAVDFTYLSTWSSYFDVVRGDVINPSDENALPDVPIVSQLLSFLPTRSRRYQTPYDISLPILVTVKDARAFNNKGYEFLFALEANIRDNEPLEAGFESFGRSTSYETGFSLLCNENQKTSPPITIRVVDGATRQPVRADVFFGECSVGVTGADGTLTSPFPKGILELKVTAEGHLAHTSQQSTLRSKTIPVSLVPLREKKITVQKFTYEKQAASVGVVRSLETDATRLWQRSAIPTNLLPNEMTVLSLEQVGEDFTTGTSVMGTSRGTMMLAPGRYKVTATTMLNEQVVIPVCRSCQCTDYETHEVLGAVGLAPDVECVKWADIDEMRMGPPFTEGTVEYIVDIDAAMLNSPQDLKFFTLALNMRDVPATRSSDAVVRERMVSDLNVLDTLRQHAANDPGIRDRLKPVLVSS